MILEVLEGCLGHGEVDLNWLDELVQLMDCVIEERWYGVCGGGGGGGGGVCWEEGVE